jgi:hypothetical protein
MRFVIPYSDRATVEISGCVGLDFRSFTLNNSNVTLSGSDAAFFSKVKIATALSIFKQLSYVAWIDAWFDLGTLSGSATFSSTVVDGTLEDNLYRLRFVPLGLRLKF